MRWTKKILHIAAQLILGWALVSCLTPIDIDIEGSGNKIVIVGQVSTLPDRTFVQVGETAGTARLPFGITFALVELVDANDNTYRFTEVFSERNPGRYVLPGFTAVPGETYFIRVSLAEGIYESTPERVPLQTGTDELSHEFSEDTVIDLDGIPFTNKMIRVYSTPSLPADAGPLFIKWDLQEVYIILPTDFPDLAGLAPPSCYVTQAADPQRIVLLDGSRFSASSFSRTFLGWRVVGQTFHTRHYFVSYMGSITPEAYDYWRRVNILANQVGSIFDTPPSPLVGNIYNINNLKNPMLGYFQAVNESTARFSLTKFDLPFILPAYCTYNAEWAFSRYANECIDCIKVRNSSYERPSWFGE